MSKFTDQKIDQLIDEFMTEKNNLMNDLKNDKEMTKTLSILNKIGFMDSIIKTMIKYRNKITSDKLKADL
jgi:hypothetical protein